MEAEAFDEGVRKAAHGGAFILDHSLRGEEKTQRLIPHASPLHSAPSHPRQGGGRDAS